MTEPNRYRYQEDQQEQLYSGKRSAQQTLDFSFKNSRALAALQQLKEPVNDQQANEDADSEEDEQLRVELDEDRTLPSRKLLFPSNYARWTKWFYNILCILFFGLFICLLIWGNHLMSTEG